MRVRSAAAPRRVRATGPAAAVAAAAPCAALLDGVRASVVGVVVACAGPLAPALRLVSQRFKCAAAMNVLSLQQCAELSGIEALQRVCNRSQASNMQMLNSFRFQLLLRTEALSFVSAADP